MSEDNASSALNSSEPEIQTGFSAGLALVATPIGNLGDITLRAIQTLRAADLILCEDTRVTSRLLIAHGIQVPMSPLHDHNEEGRIPALLEAMRGGQRIALVSDAGTPLLSDPGYRLARAAMEADIPVTALPGANAATMALTLSGLPPLPFMFLGFPPPRQAARRTAFGQLLAAERAGIRATFIWHEAPHRLAEMLDDLQAIFGDRPAAVARELTKRFEEVRRAPLSGLIAHYAEHAPRGEIVVLLGPPGEDAQELNLDALLQDALKTHSAKDAAAMVAAATGLPRKIVYRRILDLDQTPDDTGS